MKTLAILLLLLSVILVSGGCATEITNEIECTKASCCHETECVSADQAPDCSDVFCTQECVEGTLDCGQGSCQVIEGECKAVFNE